jgi:hypothetical protein
VTATIGKSIVITRPDGCRLRIAVDDIHDVAPLGDGAIIQTREHGMIAAVQDAKTIAFRVKAAQGG